MPRAPQIDDKITPMDIADAFSEKYETFYNSVPSEQYIMHQINKRIEDDLHECNGIEQLISVGEMKKAIGMISDKKSDGDGKLLSNHVIHAPGSFTVHLSLRTQNSDNCLFNP